MLSFKDYFLNELSLISSDIKINDYSLLKNYKDFVLNPKYVLTKNGFDFILDDNYSCGAIVIIKNELIYGYLTFAKTNYNIHNKTIVSVKISKIHNDLKGKSMGYEMYKILLDFFIITNDKKNSQDSQKVWERLYKDFYSYKFDLYTGKIFNLSKNWKDEIWTDKKEDYYKVENIRILASKGKL